MYRLLKRIILSTVVVLAAISCDYKSEAIGVQDGIYVFADSTIWLQVEKDVELAFNNFIYTPRAERSFGLQWMPLSELNSLRERMNIMFIGTTQEGGAVNDYLMRSLPPEVISQVKNNNTFYFFQDDLFARDQVGLFLMAPDVQTFKENFSRLKDEIYNAFEKKYFKRLKESMYDKAEQTEIEEFLAEKYGYGVRVQHDYFLATQDPAQKYVWMRRINPDRWLSIWKVDADSALLTKEGLMQARNRMTASFYQGDSAVAEETFLSIVPFRGEQTHKLVGTWKNDSLLVGGPFRLYAIPKPDENAVYLLDLAVMAPDKRKKPFLDQLEVIASTFYFSDKNEKEKK